MTMSIFQGSTPTLRFTLQDGLSVTDPALGEPTVTVAQDEVVYILDDERITVDSGTNSVSVTLTEGETIGLVDGYPITAELVYSNDSTESVYRFPPFEIMVLESTMGPIYDHMEPDDPGATDFDPDDIYEDVITDGEVEEDETIEVYEIEDYMEYYDDTLEPDPEDLYPIEDVEPAEDEGE